ncbi:LytR/AlgR family response regulator transcription factor [Neptunicella marina]|uniref:Response regulator transcription factor n=1 Tax=Neptunicella marina TaxID=2125989 RepID=A0A8J6IUV2_9ALTE|nr:LytTR family DNA-binding domain-containing protein [Neptunicella marina]MBC3766337.1 response regulator transcription factor [Neptunicella marina]
MNLIVVEDEYMVAKRLMRFIQLALPMQKLNLVHFTRLDDANDYLASHAVDLLFLDLNLQGQDGFELLKQQLSKSFHTIVVSANTDRAIEAFELGVVDFIAKPFSADRIATALQRVQSRIQQVGCEYLCYRHIGKMELLRVADINYIKAAGHYSEIICKNGQHILHDKNLDRLLTLLPPDYIRIHRSYVVAISSISNISGSSASQCQLELHCGTRLPVGRTRYHQLKQRLGG